MREIGQIKREEVEAFQRRHGLQVDGVVGNQTFGKVLDLELQHTNNLIYRDYLLDYWEAVRTQNPVPPPPTYKYVIDTYNKVNGNERS